MCVCVCVCVYVCVCVCVCVGGAYAWDKNTSARICAKNAGGAYARGGRICGTVRYNLLPIGNIAVQKTMGNVLRYCLGTCNRLYRCTMTSM